MKIIHRKIVAGVLFSSDQKIFLAFKVSRGTYPNTWHLPGGGVNEGESRHQALIREIHEEIGIDISTQNIGLIDDTATDTAEKMLKETGEIVQVEMDFFVYKVLLSQTSADIAIQLNEEFSQYGWFSLAELQTLQLAPPTVKLFKKFHYV